MTEWKIVTVTLKMKRESKKKREIQIKIWQLQRSLNLRRLSTVREWSARVFLRERARACAFRCEMMRSRQFSSMKY